MTSVTVGQRIRMARLKKGLTQNELAKKVKATSHTIISDYESGKRGRIRPDIQLLLRICKELDISFDWLFLGKDKQ